MKREDLGVFLQREVARWSAKSYEALRQELREDYVHVSVAVCSERLGWSCIHPLSASFLVYRDGRVEKKQKSLSTHLPASDV